jgi:hypothetical protein
MFVAILFSYDVYEPEALNSIIVSEPDVLTVGLPDVFPE